MLTGSVQLILIEISYDWAKVGAVEGVRERESEQKIKKGSSGV